nr:reverse transcriptase domain-containing protein [Tanacetum cinerariifolium]
MDLKLAEESKAKYSIEEPPKLELKELPSHLEYAFLEDSNKLQVIIAKNLEDVEREALINVLKSYKRAIAWKISDIKGIDLGFCTHKILMEDDYKPAVQSQRRVNIELGGSFSYQIQAAPSNEYGKSISLIASFETSLYFKVAVILLKLLM